jgi:acyl carrier protein
MTAFEKELRDKIIERLHLEDLDASTIDGDTLLFGEGFGLDSIDALELELMIKEEYAIIVLQSERNRSTFGTLGILASFIEENRGRDLKKVV